MSLDTESRKKLEMKRLLYIFTGGRRSRFLAARAGQEAPLEFLCGVTYLQSRGYEVDILELSDLSPDQSSPGYIQLARQNAAMQRATGFTSTSHLFVDSINTLNQYDAIIAVGDSVAFGISHFALHGTVRPPMFGVAMGMLLHTHLRVSALPLVARARYLSRELYYRFAFGRYRKRRRLYRQLLEASSGMLYFERSEYEMARQMFPEFSKVMRCSPSCIDTDYWRPSLAQTGTASPRDVILFIGNDRGRDFGLLLNIARRLPHYRFVFITNRIRQEQVSRNVTLMRGDWRTNLLSDVEIRRIVRDSAIVVLPMVLAHLRTLTSVALQAMACEKPVLVSKTSGLWEPEIIDREHVWLIHSGRLSEWCESIETLMRDSVVRERIGANARRLVEAQNNLTVLGSNVETLINQ